MQKQKIINGINTDRLFEIINTVKRNPLLSKFQFRAKNTWMNGFHNRSVIKGFYGADREDNSRNETYILDNDHPYILLGSDKGAFSIEYILNALAACLTNSIVYNAATYGINLESIESELEGNLNLNTLFGFPGKAENQIEDIKVKIRIEGSKLSEEEKKLLIGLSKKSSPIYKMITNPFPVTVSSEDELYND